MTWQNYFLAQSSGGKVTEDCGRTVAVGGGGGRRVQIPPCHIGTFISSAWLRTAGPSLFPLGTQPWLPRQNRGRKGQTPCLSAISQGHFCFYTAVPTAAGCPLLPGCLLAFILLLRQRAEEGGAACCSFEDARETEVLLQTAL